jgi:hypothetical protein
MFTLNLDIVDLARDDRSESVIVCIDLDSAFDIFMSQVNQREPHYQNFEVMEDGFTINAQIVGNNIL